MDDWSWYNPQAAQPTRINVMECQIGSHIMPLHHYTVFLPLNSRLQWRAFSPQGDQIAWQLVTPADSQSPQRMEVWVSHLDGTHWRRIGSMPEQDVKQFFQEYSLKWVPDGKRLSFVYEDALYTVSISQTDK